MQTTPTYGFKLPEDLDAPNNDDFNYNFQKVEDTIKTIGTSSNYNIDGGKPSSLYDSTMDINGGGV